MLSWTIGDVTVKRIVELEMASAYNEKYPFIRQARPEELLKIDWLQPHFITPDGAIKWSVHALLVEPPGLKLVVDTCVGNDKPRGMTQKRPLATDFLAQLGEAGWRREDVNAVVCTHLHVDHVGWNTMLDGDRWVPTFPNARYLIGRTEFAHWSSLNVGEVPQILADSVQPIFDAGLADLVETDHVISPELRLTPTLGHTPGHVSVVIESKGERAIITGDLMHHPCQIAHPEWSPDFDSDKDMAAATRKSFVCDAADQPTLIIGTHFSAPTAGRIVRDGESFRLAV